MLVVFCILIVVAAAALPDVLSCLSDDTLIHLDFRVFSLMSYLNRYRGSSSFVDPIFLARTNPSLPTQNSPMVSADPLITDAPMMRFVSRSFHRKPLTKDTEEPPKELRRSIPKPKRGRTPGVNTAGSAEESPDDWMLKTMVRRCPNDVKWN